MRHIFEAPIDRFGSYGCSMEVVKVLCHRWGKEHDSFDIWRGIVDMEMYEFQEHLQDVIYFYLIIKLVWKEALSLICDEDKCTLHAVETIMVNWKEDKEVVDHVVLLVIMIWYVWLSRNSVIYLMSTRLLSYLV